MNLNGFPDIPDLPVIKPFRKSLQKVKPHHVVSNSSISIKKKHTIISIDIDKREHDLYQAMIKLDTSINIRYKVMPIGDVAIYSEKVPTNTESNEIDYVKTLLQIYERKTIADLLASIIDGRYKEQSYRLLSSVELPPHNMVYLVEGELPKNEQERQRVLSAMTSIQYFKTMTLLRSQTVDETAEILVRTAEKIERELNEPVSAAAAQSEQSYVGGALGASQVKNQNITPDNIGEIILSTIPGVSNITAHSVMQQFGTFRGLMEYLLQEGSNHLLEEIRIGDSGKSKKGRKIGKNCVANIRRFLLSTDNVNERIKR